MAERRDAADRKPRRLTNLVAARLAHSGAELGGVDAPVAGAEAQERTAVVDEDERLHDLTELRTDRFRRVDCRSGRRLELTHFDREIAAFQALLQPLSRWV